MYQIYADETLIYDSTLEDYKIVKGEVSLETNKSGSFTFSIYPDHFYYDKFIRRKTIITVYKSGKIVFRGHILNDVTNHWNNKVITCEGELGFLQDSIIRPFNFKGTPEDLFTTFIESHNSQVDESKQFKLGIVTVYADIERANTEYDTTLNSLNDQLIGDSLGGYLYITHGDDGKDPIPTIHYIADFDRVSPQKIEFGSNLKNYTKTVKAEELATAIIPLGATVDDGNDETEDPKLTIEKVNGGLDYVYSEEGVARYGWIFKVISWDDVTNASTLKAKAEEYLESVVNQNITIELTAIDLHLLDKSIESFGVGDYIHIVSAPHNFDAVLLCNKQTINLLRPDNDTVTLGYTYSSFTEVNSRINTTVSTISTIQKKASNAESIAKGSVMVITDLKTEIDDKLKEITTDLGSEDVWTYRKWDNGLVECWGTIDQSVSTSSGTTTAGSNTSTYYATLTKAFPTNLFIDTPLVLATANDSGAGVVTVANDNSTNVTCIVTAWGSNTALGSVNVLALGKWK